MKSTLALSLCSLVTTGFAQEIARKVPAERPPVDPDRKVLMRVDPPKGPGLTYEPALSASNASPPPVRTAPAPLPYGAGRPHDRVLFDEPTPGTTWARGATWKARFASDGATFVPFFGASAPRNFPIDLILRRVEVDGQPLPLAAKASVRRAGSRIDLDWGTTTEGYELRPDSVEQTFTFAKLPARGELTVRLGVATELTGSADATGLHFANDLGRVDYGTAIVEDAHGQRVSVAERLVDGAIELTVPAAFVANAALPITIDPALTVQTPGYGSQSERSADVTYDLAESRFMVVWEDVFAANDSDVYTQLLDEDGVPISGTLQVVDTSTTTWARPRIADLRIPSNCLIAAEVGAPGFRTIKGRIRGATLAGTTGSPFEISANGGAGEKFNVDVGGDPSLITPTYWLVVWERGFTTTDHDIAGQLVAADGSLFGPMVDIDNSYNSMDTHPSVAKSDGNGMPASQVWNVVYQHTYSATDEDIWCAAVRWDGVVVTPSGQLDTSIRNDTVPAVSSVTDQVGSASRQWLAVYQREIGGLATALIGNLRQGTNSQTFNMTSLEGTSPAHNQYRPHVDSDGCRFAVTYEELASSGYSDTRVSTFHVVHGTSLGLSDTHVALGTIAGASERMPRICSMRSGGRERATRYITAWDRVSGTSDVVAVAAYDGNAPGQQLVMLPTGCAGLDLTASGYSLLGQYVTFQVQNAGTDAPLVMFGRPIPPVTACGPCGIGVDLGTATFVAGGWLPINIPRDGEFVNASLAIQGLTIGNGPCLGQIRTSTTAVMTVR